MLHSNVLAALVTDLYAKIKQIPLEEHDNESLPLIKNFVQQAQSVKGLSDGCGFEILWPLALENVKGVSATVSENAFEILLELFSTEKWSTEKFSNILVRL